MTTIAAPQRRRRTLKPLTWVGVIYLAIMLFIAVFPNAVTTQDYAKQNLRNRLKPPAWLADGNWINPLGTDHLGRDTWARIVIGARVSLLIAGGAVLVAGTLGTVLGLIAGYAGGIADEIIMRLADIQLSFPPVLLLVAVMAVIGTSIQNIILVLGLVSWVQYARVVRGATLSIKEEMYIEAARSVGATGIDIMRRHILPNVLPTLMVIAAVNASQQILNEAALSFLGLGVQPPTPAWGSMLSEGQQYFQVALWNAVFPGLAILLIVLAINLVADELAARR
ncbi:MAG: ABC transporter permease [Anaerolineae bacterium]|nr:ABC transporter permease [Anaerolineae bacterium]